MLESVFNKVNIEKFLRAAFLIKHIRWLLLFPEKHEWERRNRFIFLIKTTE